MVAIKNLEKYFEDHPNFAERKDEILDAARKASENGTVITGGTAKKILGVLAPAFFAEIENDPDHMQIGVDALREFSTQ